MELKWNCPKWKYGFNPPAVYRLDFDNGYFYIGSSKRVKSRINSWKGTLRRDVFQSKIFPEYIANATTVKVTILEMPPLVNLKDRETHYLLSSFSDSMVLNQCPTGYNNEGVRQLPPHLKKPKKEKKPPQPTTPPKLVIQLSLDGKFIRTHKSIYAAAEYMGLHNRTMQKHLNYLKVRGLKGYVFRKAGELESFQLIKKTEKKKGLMQIDGKPVIDLNTGVFYHSVKDLSRCIGQPLKKWYKILSEERKPNTSQYRYA